MISFTDDSNEIKDLLAEILKCQVNEFKGEKEHERLEEEKLTEPNDSPFRVRRLSRSFSIPNGAKLGEEEILLSANDENKETENVPKMKFIVLKRSRSLGNIFLPDLPLKSSSDKLELNDKTIETEITKYKNDDDNVGNLTEKVEALEIEVLKEEIERSPTVLYERRMPLIDRPQTSPPILNIFKKGESDEPITKLSILDRMQKSLGFFFRCARKDENSEEEGVIKYPMRSRTPDAKFSKSRRDRKSVGETKSSVVTTTPPPPAEDVPTQTINFVTKVDEEQAGKCGDIVKKLPTFYDVSGPKGPLLQPQCSLNAGKKCLVLDLDETLVHSSFHVPEAHDLVVTLGLPDGSQQNIYVAKRPGVDEFLAKMSEIFEIVIFTASLAHYADPVIDFLAQGMNRHLKEPREINLRLYRESCLFLRGLYVKDLSRLGRKLEQTVIVDNSPASFLLQPEHGIPIKSWFSDIHDKELDLLHCSLMHLLESDSVADWRSKFS